MSIKIKQSIAYDDREVNQSFPEKIIGLDNDPNDATTKKTVELFTVAAAASDEALSIQARSSIKYVYIEDFNGSGTLSVKVNSGDVAFGLNNYLLISEDLTSITASNSSATDSEQIRIITIEE